MNVKREYGNGCMLHFSEQEVYGAYNTLVFLADCAQDEEDKEALLSVAQQLHAELHYGKQVNSLQ